jgi:hypothetical protein
VTLLDAVVQREERRIVSRVSSFVDRVEEKIDQRSIYNGTP